MSKTDKIFQKFDKAEDIANEVSKASYKRISRPTGSKSFVKKEGAHEKALNKVGNEIHARPKKKVGNDMKNK